MGPEKEHHASGDGGDAPLRIAYVCTDFGVDPSGTKGASIHLRAITGALCELGHEVWILSPHEGPPPPHPAHRLVPPGCRSLDKQRRRLKRWLTARGFADTVAREIRPLLYNPWVLDSAVEAAREVAPDVVLERLSLFGHVGLDLAQRLGVPFALEVNAPFASEARAHRSLQLVELAGEVERKLLAEADAILAVSSQLTRELGGGGVSPEKLHVVPNGVDRRPFEAAAPPADCRARLGLDGRFVVGFAGSLKPWHGLAVLLEAFDRFRREEPDAHLLIVGDGPAAESLREDVAARGMGECVTFTGAVPHERVPEHLRAMDVAVAPFSSAASFYFSPIKLFEYMAAGTCVVASGLGQIAEVLEEGVDGLLCEPDDPAALAARLGEARRSPELRHRLGERARRKVLARYTWEHAARRTAAVLQTLVSRRGEAASAPSEEQR